MNNSHDDQTNPIVELLRDEWLTAGALRRRKLLRDAQAPAGDPICIDCADKETRR